MKRGADWLSWSLQFIAGFIVGAIIALCLITRGNISRLTVEDVVSLILAGAFIVAGLASFYGDRLWLGSSYRIIPPDDIKQSELSRTLSVTTGMLGVCLILRDLLHHFGIY